MPDQVCQDVLASKQPRPTYSIWVGHFQLHPSPPNFWHSVKEVDEESILKSARAGRGLNSETTIRRGRMGDKKLQSVRNNNAAGNGGLPFNQGQRIARRENQKSPLTNHSLSLSKYNQLPNSPHILLWRIKRPAVFLFPNNKVLFT